MRHWCRHRLLLLSDFILNSKRSGKIGHDLWLYNYMGLLESIYPNIEVQTSISHVGGVNYILHNLSLVIT